ncbi:hypothetical protein GQX74_015340 [Glossina fuscipes]|nr:hypothetical protein GQX74_015340 [Glossina fuscipes]
MTNYNDGIHSAKPAPIFFSHHHYHHCHHHDNYHYRYHYQGQQYISAALDAKAGFRGIHFDAIRFTPIFKAVPSSEAKLPEANISSTSGQSLGIFEIGTFIKVKASTPAKVESIVSGLPAKKWTTSSGFTLAVNRDCPVVLVKNVGPKCDACSYMRTPTGESLITETANETLFVEVKRIFAPCSKAVPPSEAKLPAIVIISTSGTSAGCEEPFTFVNVKASTPPIDDNLVFP